MRVHARYIALTHVALARMGDMPNVPNTSNPPNPPNPPSAPNSPDAPQPTEHQRPERTPSPQRRWNRPRYVELAGIVVLGAAIAVLLWTGSLVVLSLGSLLASLLLFAVLLFMVWRRPH